MDLSHLGSFENRLKILALLCAHQTTGAAVALLGGPNQEQKVIAAIFFDCLVHYIFDDFGKDSQNQALRLIMDDDNPLKISASDINIGRYLAQSVGDEYAILVAKKAANTLGKSIKGDFDAHALGSLLMAAREGGEKTLKFDTENFAKAISLHNSSPKDNKKHEQGTSTSTDYVGEWKDGKRHGQATHTSCGQMTTLRCHNFANGDKYVGEFRDDKFHGQGTYTHANGDKFVGEFRDGEKHGQGTYTWPSGDKCVGEWRDGKRHGQGTYTYADGRVREGVWENDELKPRWKFW